MQNHRPSLLHLLEWMAPIAVSMLGLVALWTTWDIDSSIRQVGPLVGIVLIFTGIWYLAELLNFHNENRATNELVPCPTTDWYRLGMIAAGLVSFVVLVHRAGFIISSTVLILIAAYGFGSQRLVRTGLSAVAVSAAVAFTFDRWLDVQLPGGFLTSII